jgi:hypothetical protein
VERFGGVASKIEKDNQYCEKCIERLSLIREIKKSEKEIVKFVD